MKNNDFYSVGIDELSSLHGRATSMPTREVADEKVKLEKRLLSFENSGLENPDNAISANRPRRAYLKVFPKYQNSKKCRREMVRSRKATSLGADAAQGSQSAPAFSHCAIELLQRDSISLLQEQQHRTFHNKANSR
jgi:hypothetical protein